MLSSEKKCKDCGVSKPRTEFYSWGSGMQMQWTARCKQCHNKWDWERRKFVVPKQKVYDPAFVSQNCKDILTKCGLTKEQVHRATQVKDDKRATKPIR